MQLTALLQAALQRQRQGDLSAAEAMFRQAIQTFGPTPDSLHLLGLVRARQGDLCDGVKWVARALDACGWSVDSYKQNLTLMTARLLRQRAEQRPLPSASNMGSEAAVNANGAAPADKTVSVVLLVNGNVPGLQASLDSVAAQTQRPQLVIVVADDGELIKLPAPEIPAGHNLFSSCSPCKPCLSPTTLASHANNAIRSTETTFVQLLLAGDALAPDCLKTMVARCSGAAAVVGFSRIQVMDGPLVVDELSDPWVFDAACAQSAISASPAVGLSLIRRDVSFALGNLFLDRSAFDVLGGFDDATGQFSWAYQLKSLWLREPVFVDRPLYRPQRDALNGWRATSPTEVETKGLETQLQRWWHSAFEEPADRTAQTVAAVSRRDELFLIYLESRASALDGWVHLQKVVSAVLATDS